MSLFYRLSLDMNTTTIGWAMWELSQNQQSENKAPCPVRLADMGVRVFSEGREPPRNGKTGNSLAVQRRLSRQIRKNRRRNKRRKQAVIRQLIKYGLLPENRETRHILKNTHPDCLSNPDMGSRKKAEKNRRWNPYCLRSQALDRQLTPWELGKVLTHLTSRRGYRNNSADSVTDQMLERKKNLLKIRELEQELSSSGCRTLGEFLWQKAKHNFTVDDGQERAGGNTAVRQTIRFKPDMVRIFPSRQMYIDEFNAIRTKQEQYFPDVDWDKLRRLMYHQRPLKTPDRSFCPYCIDPDRIGKSELRGFRAQPSAHRFRILRMLEQMTYTDDNDITHFLTNDQKDILFSILETQKSLSWTEAAKRIGLPAGGYFSAENGKNQKMIGNETACDMRKPELFGTLWDGFSEEVQDDIIEELITDSEETDITHRLESMPLSPIRKQNILNYAAKAATAPYSAKLMRNCAALMRNEHLPFDEALVRLGLYPSSQQRENSFAFLPYYGEVLPETVTVPSLRGKHGVQLTEEQQYGKIWNPTAHNMFNQTRVLVNALIRRYGKPAEITFRISAELKKSRDGRDALMRSRDFYFKEQQHVRKTVQHICAHQKNGCNFSRWHYTAWKLWNELENFSAQERSAAAALRAGNGHAHETEDNTARKAKTCVYCGKPLTFEQIISGEGTLGYIIPFSRTLDNSNNNMTVAHRACLEAKGTRSPHEAFGTNPEGFNWQDIHRRAKHFHVRKRALFSSQPDAAGGAPDVPADTSFLARKTAVYLSSVCPARHVEAVSGSIPGLLYRKWKLHRILENETVKTPVDYRHYSLNALIIGLTDKSLVQQFSAVNSSVWRPPETAVPPFPFPVSEVTATLKAVLVSYKPAPGRAGKLFDETALGKHFYQERHNRESFRQENLPFVINAQLRAEAHKALDSQGWRKTRDILFENISSVLISKPCYVTRKKLLLCTERDIERIIDPSIRNHLRQKLTPAANEQERRMLLEEFIAHTGIRRVRIIPKGQEAIPIRSCPNKAYAPADFLFVDIWRIPAGNRFEFRGIFVSRFESFSYRKEQTKPHPAAKFMCRLFKNDTLRIHSHSASVFYVRVAGFATTQQKIDIRPLSAAAPIPEWSSGVTPIFTELFWNEKKSPQNHTAINSIFSANHDVRKVYISPDGKTRQAASGKLPGHRRQAVHS